MTGAESDDPRAEDSLRSLVRMAREDFDEEPSPRIDALLMAAARKHAPAPELGLFARLRRWLSVSMMNPAIAGATALVVIGGTAGVLYLRDPARRVAEPTMAGEARGTAVVTADKEPAPAPEPARALEGGKDVVVGLIEPPSGPIELATPETPRARPPRRDVATGGNGALEQQAATELSGLKSDMRTTGSPPPPPPPPDLQLAEGDSVPATPGRAGAAADEVAVADSGGARGGGGAAADDAETRREQAENLLRQARTAAKNRNCPPVKVMAQRAKKLDARYYDATFRTDPDVKTCLD